ncbi:putative ABC-type sugar transport system, permease component [Arthrobacter sp. PAMC 25486]|uniref:carbohydrate ABC transporter permease n=1 Tax=Arthrobacter sp. PAMC 25486 TaxID=1494608 RepID=UPI000535FD30|nr:sugar ABC transporter permease [Arthrobacter sp. PAMC 25486]AIY02965.1 putative ABC-type sugar transport system, permease component [Arthrobacter sp. PAMC 25486]
MTLRTAVSPPRARESQLQDAPSKHYKWRKIAPFIYIGPAVAYLLVFMVIPVVQGIQLSFTKTPLVKPDGGTAVGLDNYTRLLSSSHFYNSLWATIVYTAATVIFAVLIGVGAALLLNRAFKGRTIARAIITFPWAVPTVATALIFSWIFNRSDGVLNQVVGVFGIGQQGWLVDPKYGMAAVVLASVWKVMPLVMLVVLASLQSVPGELYEATRVDGASAFDAFKAVTWPHIAPTVRVVALLMTIWSIRRFEIIYLLTGGGPVDSTNTLVVNVYRQAFSNQELGRAAAIGTLGLVLSLLITVLYFMLERRSAAKEA